MATKEQIEKEIVTLEEHLKTAAVRLKNAKAILESAKSVGDAEMVAAAQKDYGQAYDFKANLKSDWYLLQAELRKQL